MNDPSRGRLLSSDEARGLATSLLSDVSGLADAMLQYIVTRLPEVVTDDEVRGLTLGSCSSNLEAALSMVRHGIDVSAAQAPVTALEHARAMAARGHSVDVMLRFYRLGHEFFVEQLSAVLIAREHDSAEALAMFIELERFALRYIDLISSQVALEYVATLSKRQNEARIERADIVRSLLAGESVDAARAERALSHRLTGKHLALICWSDERGRDLDKAVQRIASAIGTGRPLVIPDGPLALWAWLGVGEHLSRDLASAALRDQDPHVFVALGSVHVGAEGFRTSHLEATRARRIAELCDRDTPSATHFRDIALADALSTDFDTARRLVEAELVDLADDTAAARNERATLLAVLDCRGSLAAAAELLAVHRNTVLQRVRRAEQKVGRPITERVVETHAALVLADIFGSRVLRQQSRRTG
ncbi:PucR family transcriptional regulator [Williamsia sp. M5A3_1d]